MKIKNGLHLLLTLITTSSIAAPWVEVNVDSLQGTVSRLPQADELEQSVNVQLVVEFYSR